MNKQCQQKDLVVKRHFIHDHCIHSWQSCKQLTRPGVTCLRDHLITDHHDSYQCCNSWQKHETASNRNLVLCLTYSNTITPASFSLKWNVHTFLIHRYDFYERYFSFLPLSQQLTTLITSPHCPATWSFWNSHWTEPWGFVYSLA